MTPAGTLTVLYNFCAQSKCTDGWDVYAGLVQADNGDFYGITYGGGAQRLGHDLQNHPEWQADDAIQLLFPKVHGHGGAPTAALIQASNGDFYGTTHAGGRGYGTVFKISASGALTTLHSFCSQKGCTDGDYPYAPLVQATDGNFYGTTSARGAKGYGTIFKTPRAAS